MSAAPRSGTAPVVEQLAQGRLRERFALGSSGVWAAVQSIGLSYAVVALLAVVAVLDAPSASGADGGLGAGVAVATGLWLLGHGVPLSAAGATLTVVPLGITALALFTLHVAAKRSAVPTLAAWVAGTVTYAAATATLAIVLDVVGATAATSGATDVVVQVGAAVVGGLVVGGGGIALGMFSAPDGPLLAGLAPRMDPYLPDTLRLGMRAAVVGVALLVGLGGLLVGVWVVLGRETASLVAGGLGASGLGVVLLLLGQAVLVPNLVVWATSWIAGPGFVVGEGGTFSAATTEAAALPAVPLLGVLPGESWSTPYAAWAPVLVVACGAVGGWFAWQRLEPSQVAWRDLVWIVTGTTLAAGALTVVLQWVAGGSAGAGALAVVGADVWLTGGLVAAEVGGGAAIVLLAHHLVGRVRHP
ncbi:cell division protein PerM [Isoptericola rhizosphaerae]|uniref:cell division protein PerM n=1 Tax=Isoptericola rhizosphaerae TaxID=3377837 RepID=UPI00383AB65E